jgi:DNA-binding NtrC family response regulator
MKPLHSTLMTVQADALGRPEKLILQRVALRIVQGPEAGRELEISHTPFIIGKDPLCDLALADPSVSSRHAGIMLQPGGYLIKDLGSRNGILVGGMYIEEAYLAPEVVLLLGDTALQVIDLQQAVEVPLSGANHFGDVLGRSMVMRRMFAELDMASRSMATVLLEGETGTGKGVLAEALHQQSPIADGPFVVFDCSAVTPTLMESELFGHEKGAFTGATCSHVGVFEQAHGGTLFLDEIGELSLDLQPKLLRALEAHKVRRLGGTSFIPFDARFVGATNLNLQRLVAQGKFRSDLFYRLAVLHIHVPPLRERLEDLPLLFDHFSRVLKVHGDLRRLFPSLIPLLKGYHWPGNVRELRNVVERLGLLPMHQALPGVIPVSEGEEALPTRFIEARDRALDQFERSYLQEMLNCCRGNVTKAAEKAGVSRRYLTKLIAKHQLQRGEDEDGG